MLIKDEVFYKSMTTDGLYIYYQETRRGIFKIGTGSGNTVGGAEYGFNSDYSKDNTSIACVNNVLYVCQNCDSLKIDLLSCENLNVFHIFSVLSLFNDFWILIEDFFILKKFLGFFKLNLKIFSHF